MGVGRPWRCRWHDKYICYQNWALTSSSEETICLAAAAAFVMSPKAGLPFFGAPNAWKVCMPMLDMGGQ